LASLITLTASTIEVNNTSPDGIIPITAATVATTDLSNESLPI